MVSISYILLGSVVSMKQEVTVIVQVDWYWGVVKEKQEGNITQVEYCSDWDMLEMLKGLLWETLLYIMLLMLDENWMRKYPLQQRFPKKLRLVVNRTPVRLDVELSVKLLAGAGEVIARLPQNTVPSTLIPIFMGFVLDGLVIFSSSSLRELPSFRIDEKIEAVKLTIIPDPVATTPLHPTGELLTLHLKFPFSILGFPAQRGDHGGNRIMNQVPCGMLLFLGVMVKVNTALAATWGLDEEMVISMVSPWLILILLEMFTVMVWEKMVYDQFRMVI